MTNLRLATDLVLPSDAVTQTFLVVGKRGSGKSNTAARLVEQMHRAKLPFVVLDPTDTWWGLKASVDGARGLDVYVFGGAHQDLPLAPDGGALLAEVLCEHRIPMVLSVKHLSGRERSTFMVAFAKTLFQKWAGGPLHIVLEEAHELAPQNVQNGREGEQEMLGAFKRLWKLGRASGIGGTAVTQRPASLSKDITTQSEILIAHRTIGPQDVKAVGEWVKYHGERLDILAELPSLPTGQAFVWAPEFPEGKPIGLQRTTILRRDTYDSASTPKVGEQRVEPRELASVDLERLRVQMAKTIEKAKADDPKELRKEIATLKTQLTKATKAAPALGEDDLKERLGREYMQGLDDGRRSVGAELRDIHRVIDDAGAGILSAVEAISAKMSEMGAARAAVSALMSGTAPTRPAPVRANAGGFVRTPPIRSREREQNRTPRTKTPVSSTGDLPRGQQRILNALAELEVIGVDSPGRHQLGMVAGYNLTGGTGAQHIADLGKLGLLDVGDRVVTLTDAGRAAANVDDAPSTLEELHERVLRKLPDGQRRIAEYLIGLYPESISRANLGEAVGYNLTGGTGAQHVADLVTVGAAAIPRKGEVAASDLLFPAVLR